MQSARHHLPAVEIEAIGCQIVQQGIGHGKAFVFLKSNVSVFLDHQEFCFRSII